MKKTKLFGLSALLLALGMVGCGSTDDKGPDYKTDDNSHWTVDADGNEVGKEKHTFAAYAGDDEHVPEAAKCGVNSVAFEKCETCGYIHQAKTKDALKHNYVEDATQSEAANCKEEGSKVEVCSLCQDKKTSPIEKTAHTFGTATDVAATTTSVAYKKSTCSACSQVDIAISAVAFTSTGTTSSNAYGNKDTTGATLKMSKNGNYVEYTIDCEKAITGTVYLYGWVDRYSDNGSKNFFSGNSTSETGADTKGNFALTVNGTDVTITNKKTYTEMGMTASGVSVADDGTTSGTTYERANPVMCEVGAISLKAGSNTIRYSRVDSYNLNLIDIHIIGTVAA